MPDVNCGICGGEPREPVYRGPIRNGRFGSLTRDDVSVLPCGECGVLYLDQPAAVNYEAAEYRELVNADSSPDTYLRLHDPEQPLKLELLGMSGIRGGVVMDVGCGAGSFLDVVSGVAHTTIAIEPADAYRDALEAKGHVVFPYCRNARSGWSGRVDVAVCFSVIEHVEDPIKLLEDVRELLKPGGRLLVSTPNADDWLLELLPADYAPFFFRTVHRWYFNGGSIARAANLAGFSDVHVRHVQRFDLSNLLMWLRDKRPTGLGGIPLSRALDAHYRVALEQTGRSDYLYAELVAG